MQPLYLRTGPTAALSHLEPALRAQRFAELKCCVFVSTGLGVWCASPFSLTTWSFAFLIALLKGVFKEDFGLCGYGPGYFSWLGFDLPDSEIKHQDVTCRGTMRQNAKQSRSEVSFFSSLSCFLPVSWGTCSGPGDCLR